MGSIRAQVKAPRSLSLGLLQQVAASVFSVVFPAECRICGELLVNISRLPVCDECLNSTKVFDGPQCVLCGELLLGQLTIGEEAHCGLCQRARPKYERAFAYGPYEGSLRELIHLLKYQRIIPAARPLGERLAGSMRAALRAALRAADGLALVVPIPLHRGKLSQRGFNQAEEIARAAVKALGEKVEIAPAMLARVRATTSQTGLTRHQRRENVRGAFVVPKKFVASVKGRNIILVDDVFTTGTTVEECARVLRRAGAAQVWVVTAARVSKLETAHDFGEIPMKETATAALGTAAGIQD